VLDQVLSARDEDFIVVALNIDENEDAELVRERAKGQDSEAVRWVVSPKAFTDELVSEFGPSVVVPPTAPIIVIDSEQQGAELMPSGFKDSEALGQAVEGAR
jgi:hypothetical protein